MIPRGSRLVRFLNQWTSALARSKQLDRFSFRREFDSVQKVEFGPGADPRGTPALFGVRHSPIQLFLLSGKRSFAWSPQSEPSPEQEEEFADAEDGSGKMTYFKRRRRRSGYHVAETIQKEIAELNDQMEIAQGPPDIVAHKAALRIHLRQRNMHKIVEVFRKLMERNFRPSTSYVNLYILALGALGDIEGAEEEFHSIKEKYGLHSTVATYRFLIAAYGTAKNREKARTVFGEVTEKFGTDIANYNALIDALASATDSEKGGEDAAEGMGLLKRLKSERLRPDIDTYVSLIRLHSRAGMTEQAFKFLEESAKKFQPTIMTYEALIEGLATAKTASAASLKDHMLLIVEHLIKAKLKPTTTTVDAVLHLFRKQGAPIAAFDVFAKFSRKKRPGRGCLLEAAVYSIEQLVADEQLTSEAGLKLMSEVVMQYGNRGVHLNFTGYESWLCLCYQTERYDKAVEVWDKATGMRQVADHGLIEIMMKIHLQHDRLEAAMELFDYMDRNRMEPTANHFRIAFEYFDQNGYITSATFLLARMKKTTIVPGDALKTTLHSLGLS